jgi:hypothetical protein
MRPQYGLVTGGPKAGIRVLIVYVTTLSPSKQTVALSRSEVRANI